LAFQVNYFAVERGSRTVCSNQVFIFQYINNKIGDLVISIFIFVAVSADTERWPANRRTCFEWGSDADG
jgi:hypothetical protein